MRWNWRRPPTLITLRRKFGKSASDLRQLMGHALDESVNVLLKIDSILLMVAGDHYATRNELDGTTRFIWYVRVDLRLGGQGVAGRQRQQDQIYAEQQVAYAAPISTITTLSPASTHFLAYRAPIGPEMRLSLAKKGRRIEQRTASRNKDLQHARLISACVTNGRAHAHQS